MNLKSLAKDTALYGLVSIVGRFLNYLLVPVHTYYIPVESGGYGIVSNLYAYAALLLALLTFGMETTLFRFANKSGADDKMVYSSALRMVGGAMLGTKTVQQVLNGIAATITGCRTQLYTTGKPLLTAAPSFLTSGVDAIIRITNVIAYVVSHEIA